jgi:hypothetical protein
VHTLVVHGEHRQLPGKVISVGLEFLLPGDDGRIREDYQFIEPA